MYYNLPFYRQHLKMNINISLCIILLCGAVAVSEQSLENVIADLSSTVNDIRLELRDDNQTTTLMTAIENFMDFEIDYINGAA